jgi:hypothetical protein
MTVQLVPTVQQAQPAQQNFYVLSERGATNLIWSKNQIALLAILGTTASLLVSMPPLASVLLDSIVLVAAPHLFHMILPI